jgi:hypothetical protein
VKRLITNTEAEKSIIYGRREPDLKGVFERSNKRGAGKGERNYS